MGVEVTVMETMLRKLCNELQVDSAYVYFSELVHNSRLSPTFLVEAHNPKSSDLLVKKIKETKRRYEASIRNRRATRFVDLFSWILRHSHQPKTHLLESTLNLDSLFEIKDVLKSQKSKTIMDPSRLSKYTSFFHHVTSEVTIVPILSDFKVTLGCFIIRRNYPNKVEVSERIIDKFFARNGDFITSQSQDKPAILYKIFFSHIQIIASAQFLVIPWTRSSYGLFEGLWGASSLSSTLYATDDCIVQHICNNVSNVYCKALVLLILPLVIVMVMFGYVYIFLYFCRRIQVKRPGTRFVVGDSSRRVFYLNRVLLLSSIIVLFYVYSSVCRAIFDIMRCRRLEPEGYFFAWRSGYSLFCPILLCVGIWYWNTRVYCVRTGNPYHVWLDSLCQ